ncbi:MAG TPA: AAA family ATPase [Candidatus Obscuribacterales bacterium]
MTIALSALTAGSILHRVQFVENTKSKTGIPVKANVCDEGVTGPIILPMLKGLLMPPAPGELWDCEVIKPPKIDPRKKRQRHGIIWVKPIKRVLDFELPGVYVVKKALRAKLLVLEERRCNLMLVGPQGTGKSRISRALAKLMTAKYFKVSGGLIKKHDRMLGTVNAGTKGDKLRFVFEYSPLTEALAYAQAHPNERVVVHVDEWTRIDEDARDAALDVLEGEVRILHLPNGEKIEVGPNVFFIASGNVGSQFVLRRKDAANNDRWEIFHIDYMPHDVELAHCLALKPKCPSDKMDIALKVINHLRRCYKKGNPPIPYAPSTRRSEAIAMYLASDDFANGELDFEYILELAIVNQYDGPLHTESSDMAQVAKAIKWALGKISAGEPLEEPSSETK